MGNSLKLTSIPKDLLVKLLRSSGSRDYTMEILEDDIARGAPINDDGTINLFDYGAWLFAKGYNNG
jgi:hypothetical protein